jgi:NADH:ubiquinone oxidoreductase subunit 5 (subunit L)/multisubunit Na+/H+ antiporter MnhA subunit
MEQAIQVFVFIPLLGFILSLFFSNKQEKNIAIITIGIIGIQLVSLLIFIALWFINGSDVLDYKHITFYKEESIEIFLDFYFDKITATFSLLGAFITLLVVIFSKYYLHRDSGFKRFFNTVLLFYFGYNVVVFSGNFETLFIGWEFLGITSFLLIAFYRDRYLPVKNGLKTISLYRLGDICLILALWMSHHLWHQNITFFQLNDLQLVSAHINEHSYYSVFIILMIVIAASIKSAQFPFSSWLPRAMEGPTSSTAIFYGSLSVHLGVFLLLRTYTYWQTIFSIKIIIIVIGIVTAIVANSIARVQSTVKTQIAYSSITQIAIMFIEVALGWHTLVLLHLCGNALLRTYQLLVSPSVLGYLIHDQFFSYSPKMYISKSSLLTKINNGIYILSIKEWNMDTFMYNYLWSPFKWIGKKMKFISYNVSIVMLSILFISGLLFFILSKNISHEVDEDLHLFFAFIGLLLVLKSFVVRESGLKAWFLIIMSQLFNVLSIALMNDQYEYLEITIYLISLLVAAIVGFVCLVRLQAYEKTIDLNSFNGHLYDHPRLANLFLIACLGFVGLPFTPSFIGIDLMFSHIDKNEYVLIAFTALNFLLLEISVLRIYARLFLGPDKKKTHPIAYRSS